MEQMICPVDVISVCSTEGEIRPLRLQLEGGEHQRIRMDIVEVVGIKEIPYSGVEACVFLCKARTEGREIVVELKYTFRSHTWCLLRRLR